MPTYQLLHDLIANPSEERIERILAKGGFLLPSPPSFDAATQHAPVWDRSPMTSDPANWKITALSQAELDAKAEAEVGVTRKQQVRNTLTILDNGTATLAQMRTIVAAMIRHLIKP